MSKPKIIVLSDSDDVFDWLSDGWNDAKHRGTPEANRLMALAIECIDAGEDHDDVITKLKAAGFEIVYD